MWVSGIRWESICLLGSVAGLAFCCSAEEREFRGPDGKGGNDGGNGGAAAAGNAGRSGGTGGTSGKGGKGGTSSETGGKGASGGMSGSTSSAGGTPLSGAGEGSGPTETGGTAPGAAGAASEPEPGSGDDGPCEPNPCVHGSCTADGDAYACECDDGYEGDDCEINIDDCEGDPCTNGECVDAVAGFQCDCGNSGYTGELCEIKIQNCAQTPCLNGGACTDMGAARSCDCTGTGATGVNCELDIDECSPNPCEHGTCTNGKNQYTCNCAGTGFMGTDCEVDVNECSSNPCDLLTTCTNMPGGFKCGDCPSGYTGTGLTGCTDINECATNNGGCDPLTTCTNTIGGPRKCGNCPPGYTGTGDTGCVDINECASTPCKNGGTCQNGTNLYTCSCKAPWCGSSCQNATLTINATARGFYADVDWLPPNSGFTTTGWGGSWMYASYFVFPIPNFTGNVSSVTLELEHEVYDSPDASEIVTVRDVSTAVNTLISNTSPSPTIYQDLASGTSYGNLSGWSASTVGTVRSILLSGAITPVSNARGKSFAIGVNISPVKTQDRLEYIRFSGGEEARTHRLQVVVVPP